MSLFCPKEKCKSVKGPCGCEKIMGIILIVVILWIVLSR